MVTISFWILTLLCCGYIAAYGGRDGLWAASMFIIAVLLTVPALALDRAWQQTQLPVAAVDTLYLCGMIALMARSRRYWPIWAVSFQIITVATHAATILAPGVLPKIYAAMASVWSVPLLISMALGVTLDRRAALANPRYEDEQHASGLVK